ncbi:MAG: (2Fe-2S)-binding protein [Mesorhizobium sp.]
MFRRIDDSRPPILFTFEGKEIAARAGDTVACALLQAGITAFRASVVTGEPRAPYCMMGVCFDCLVTIDGVANRQSCLTEVVAGMQVSFQNGAANVQP